MKTAKPTGSNLAGSNSPIKSGANLASANTVIKPASIKGSKLSK